MSLEFRTKYIYRTNGDVLEGGVDRVVIGSHEDLSQPTEHDLLSRRKRIITPKNRTDLYRLEHVNKDNLFVSNTEGSNPNDADWAITADILHDDGIATIDYIIKQFRGHGSEAMLLPLSLIAADPDQYATPELAMRLLSLDTHALGRHAINSTLLIPYLQSLYGDYGGKDPFDKLLA